MIRALLAAVVACVLAGGPAAASLLVIGDCIATSAGLGGQFAGATVDAKVGIPSGAIVARARLGFTDAVVSAGSNDPTNPALERNLEATRARLTGHVVWVVPQHPRAAALVRAIAARHGDAIATFTAGPDHVHPRSYRALARTVAPLLSVPPILAGARRPAAHNH